MKVLIVDDNIQRSNRLVESIEKVSGINVDIAGSITDALRYLRTTKYNTLVLDISLPRRVGESPIPEGGIEIFSRIRESDMFFKPDNIIGLTAHENLKTTYIKEFESVNWRILHYDGISDSWLEQIIGSLKYSLERGSEVEKNYLNDAVIITVTDVEYNSFLNLDINWVNGQKLDESTYFLESRFSSSRYEFNIQLFKCSRMGMIDTSILATKIINAMRPKIIIMSGICAGISDKTNIGDIVIANPSWDWQSGKHGIDSEKDKFFSIDPDHIDIDPFIQGRLQVLISDSTYWDNLRRRWPMPDPRGSAKVLIAPMASGSSVISDPDLVKSLKQQHRRLAGIDMEIYGLYRSVRLSPAPKPFVIGVKAVCDYADENKDDDWQPYAAYNSANASIEFLKRYMYDISSHLNK